MIGCILTGHGSFAPGVAGALEMIAGKQDSWVVLPFEEGMDVAFFEAEMLKNVDELVVTCEGVLIFSDLLGGSPFKAAMLASQDKPQVAVIAGANLPMLIETIGLRYGEIDLTTLIEAALATGKTGIVHPQLVIKETSEAEEEGI